MGIHMKNRLTKVLEILFIISAILLFVVFMALQVTRRDEFSPLDYQVAYLEDGAILHLEDGTVMPIQGNKGYFIYPEAKADELLTISMQLPQITECNMYITVFSTEQDIGIYIAGEKRAYYSDKESRLAGTYSASRFVSIPVYPQDSRKELKVTYKTSIADYAGVLACPNYSTQQDMLYWIYFRYISQIVAAVLLTAVGIIFVFFGIILRKKNRDSKGIGYLGIFSLVIAIWLLCQSNMRVIYSSYLPGVNLMALYMVMAAPIPILMFFNELMRFQYQTQFNVLILISAADVVFGLVMEFAGFTDVINLLPAAYVIIVVCCFVCMVNFLRYIRQGDIAEPGAVILGMMVFFGVVVLEVVNLMFFNFFFVGKYLGYGILFFLINFGYSVFRSSEEQASRYREAVHANKVKSDFLANMSHEIRTPISTIMGMNEMIINECEENDIVSYAQNIRNAGNILLSLVNNILDFTKIETGKTKITPVRYELRNVLNDLVQSIDTKAADKGLSLELDVERTMPNFLYGDEIKIKQAVTNLLTNAVKYTHKGSITLSVRYINVSEDEICLHISVADTGIGIRKEDQKRLFESFVRLDETRNRSIEGTGLGLAITSHIINEMNGKIEFSSEYGKGSVFTISILQKVLSRQPVGGFEDWYQYTVERPRRYLDQYDASRVRLLVVDDNEMNLEVIKGLLKKTGARIDTVTNGSDCLKLIKDKEYDLILMDYMMPDMDGIETFQKIQKLRLAGYGRTPVIALTANAGSGVREDYLRQGFADYIAKPVEYKKLIDVMKKFLPGKVKLRRKLETTQNRSVDYLESRGIHAEAALKYTAGDFDQYIHLLELFTQDRGQNKQQLLEEVYEQHNWKNYTVYVHGLKNCARMIGADELADMACEHECRSKEHDEKYIKQNFEVLINKWNKTVDIISGYLDKHADFVMQCKGREVPTDALVLRESEWRKKLECIAAYLDEFKKKEALGLLEDLKRYELSTDQQQQILKITMAVRSYEYERAIMLLRQ